MFENFVSNEENDKVVEKTFTIIGFSALAIVVCGALVWAYNISERNQYFFISILALFMLFYAIIIIAIVVINKDNYDILSYSVLFGITIFVIFTSFLICIFFLFKYFNVWSSSSKNIIYDPALGYRRNELNT
jgi:hypothetical protein